MNKLNLPEQAVRWLGDFYEVLQVLDDLYDGDPVTQEAKRRCFYLALVSMPANPFYQQNQLNLLPLMSNLALKWASADKAEREGKHLHLCYAWRAEFFGVVLQVVSIVHGAEYAMAHGDEVMSLYAETFEEYAKEFTNA